MNNHISSPTPKKSLGRRILPALCSITGLVLLLSVIALLIPSVLPKFTDYEVCTVISGSMEPVIPVGSMVITEPVEPEYLEKRDIIAYSSNGTVVIHRVKNNYPFEGKLVTKGDANEQDDIEPVIYANVIGKVIYHFRYLGDIETYLTTTAGKIYVLLVIACGIMFQILAAELRK